MTVDTSSGLGRPERTAKQARSSRGEQGFPGFDLSGRRALITGGGRGIGRSIALGLATHGATVVVTGRDRDSLAETVALLDGDHTLVAGDLMGDEVYETLSTLNHIDIVVHNAGGDPFGKPWPEQSPQEWRDTFELNVVAAVRLATMYTPGMAERGWGRFVTIGSIFGSLGQDPRTTNSRRGAGAYVAAKHGVLGLTRYLAAQLGPSGVTVNAVSPGYISWKAVTRSENHEIRELKAGRTPVGRNGATEDVAGAVVYLASDAAAFTNGANLVVDGGWSIW